jgi:hypothetical protein
MLLPECPHFIHLIPAIDTVEMPQKMDNDELIAAQNSLKRIAGQPTPRNPDGRIKP